MKLSKIQIKNLFSLKEVALGDKDYEIIGGNKVGKTNIIEATKFGLTNKADKELILRKGADEGEVLIETDTGISIRRVERAGKARKNIIKEGKTPPNEPETFVRKLFSPIQLEPVKFLEMSKEEQNRTILDFIDFKWDLDWIKKQFGEIVPEINYNQNILQVLADIQAEKGFYFRNRQSLNTDLRNKQAFVAEIAATLPENYRATEWEKKDLGEIYARIATIREGNRKIEKALSVVENQENQMRGFEAERKIAVSALDQEISGERGRIEKDIIRIENQLKGLKDELSGLEGKRQERLEKINLEYKSKVAKYDETLKENKAITEDKIQDASKLLEEAAYADKMRSHLGEYYRMLGYQKEVEDLTTKTKGFTEKIEKARQLPAEILAKSKLPLKNLTIENGIPLLNSMPISNASDGEKLDLCVDIASTQKNQLNLLLIDGVEKLSKANRERLYSRCKERGVRFIATRTTEDDSELTIVEV